MDYEVSFEFMISCLKKWNYPQIHVMDHTEIVDIFSSKRPFLVSWLLKRLYPELLSESQNYSVDELINFMYDLGLCTKSQKSKIFSTDFYHDQLEVLFKIFSISEKILSAPVVAKRSSKLTIEDLEDFIKIDLNLFPCDGPVKMLTNEERKTLTEKLERQIQAVDSPKQPSEIINADANNTMDNEEIGKVMEDLKSFMPEFITVASDFCEQVKTCQDNDTVADEDMDNTIKRCGVNMKQISQYIGDIKTITDFAASATEAQPDLVQFHERDEFILLKKLAEQTKEIANLITLQNAKS